VRSVPVYNLKLLLEPFSHILKILEQAHLQTFVFAYQITRRQREETAVFPATAASSLSHKLKKK
jgi:hypothetical protein